MGENDWQPIATAPEGVEVETKIDDATYGVRNVQPLKRQGRLWFFPDGSMYVYYQPTHWREERVMTNPTDERADKPEAYSESELAERRREAYPHGADCICFNCSEVLLKIRRWLATVDALNRKLELAGLEAEVMVAQARIAQHDRDHYCAGCLEKVMLDKALALAIKNRDAAQAGGE